MSVAAITTRGVGFYDYDDVEPLVSVANPSSYSGTRLPDGRTLAWREYGSPRGVPCVLIPDLRSSRLAPEWLLHDSACPDGVRLIVLDRPGTGASDTLRGVDDPADDLAHMVQTLAVGRVVLIGIGFGSDAALALADKWPSMVTSVSAISMRTTTALEDDRWLHNPLGKRHAPQWHGPLDAWHRAAGRHSMLDERTWERARQRMDSVAEIALGNRWRDADFRAGVAADLALTRDESAYPEHGATPAWVHEWSSRVPVSYWHGKDESETEVSTITEIATARPHWTVTPVPGCGALLGVWPKILISARDSYLRALVR
ncbi:MAG: alpha/beta fold hydrolase [Nakamurella sp.]